MPLIVKGGCLSFCHEHANSPFAAEGTPDNAHYKHGSIDPCQYVKAMGDAEYRGACVLNILKYITRYPYKGTPMQDLLKAQDYLNMLIQHQSEKEQA